jgi:hypothetical protein
MFVLDILYDVIRFGTILIFERVCLRLISSLVIPFEKFFN